MAKLRMLKNKFNYLFIQESGIQAKKHNRVNTRVMLLYSTNEISADEVIGQLGVPDNAHCRRHNAVLHYDVTSAEHRPTS